MKLEDAVRNFAESTPQVCLLCGDHAELVGAFIPIDPTAFVGGVTQPQKGKTRTILYQLCLPCKDLPNCQDLVEAKITSH